MKSKKLLKYNLSEKDHLEKHIERGRNSFKWLENKENVVFQPI